MTLALAVGLIAAILAMTAVGILRARGDRNRTFLEWDPVDRAAWRREVDEADVHHMLAELNARRAARGEATLSMAEYVEQLRRTQ